MTSTASSSPSAAAPSRRCATSLSPATAVDAVAYAHGDQGAGERVIDLVRRAVRGVDHTYEGRSGDAEPPALVAAALADQLAVAPSAELSTLISLLVLSAAYSRLRPVIAAIALPDYAARQLEHSASSRSGGLALSPSASQLVREALADTNSHGGGDHAALVVALAERIDAFAANAERESRTLRERVDQLIWVRESWCRTAEAAWRDVEPAARPPIAAVELADHTHGVAPPPDAAALLGSVLTDGNPGLGVDPIAAIDAAGAFLEGRLAPAPHPALFPFATALERWRTRRERDFEWSEGEFGSDWEDEVAVAMQVYRESLALRGLGHG